VQLTFPDYLSEDAKDFISKLLVREPKKRLALDKVLEHPWIVNHYKAKLAAEAQALGQSQPQEDSTQPKETAEMPL